MAIKLLSETDKYKIIKVGNSPEDDNPSLVKIKKFTAEEAAIIEDTSLEGIKENNSNKVIIKYNTGSLKFLKLKFGLVEIDGKKVTEDILNNLPKYAKEKILNEIDKFNSIEEIEEAEKN